MPAAKGTPEMNLTASAAALLADARKSGARFAERDLAAGNAYRLHVLTTMIDEAGSHNDDQTAAYWTGYRDHIRGTVEAEWQPLADLLDQLTRARQVTWNLRRTLVDERNNWKELGDKANQAADPALSGIRGRIHGLQAAINQLDSERSIDPGHLPD